MKQTKPCPDWNPKTRRPCGGVMQRRGTRMDSYRVSGIRLPYLRPGLWKCSTGGHME